MVIFTPFYSTLEGKELLGAEVSHNLKSLCVFALNSSHNRSNSGIQLVAKWQFYNKTQPPA
jgi:hypothetical protein